MKTPAQVLREAAVLVEKGHCHTFLARDAEGYGCHPIIDPAVAWCVYGALWKAADAHQDVDAQARAALSETLGVTALGEWNDRRDGAEVAAAMRKAADNLEASVA